MTASDRTQPELARKAADLKAQAEAGDSRETMAETGEALHPNDPDASQGTQVMADTARKKAPSGAFEHAGDLPARERSRHRR